MHADFIRALLGDAAAEVPSPTFPLVQTYAGRPGAIAHFDFYRLTGAADLDEIGYHDAIRDSLVIVEWPERAPEALPADRLEITLAAAADPLARRVTLTGLGTMAARLQRLETIDMFLSNALNLASGTEALSISHLQGDASSRTYARIAHGARSYVLMDAPRMADGPPVRNGLPYSRIAHLAEDVRPFVAVGGALTAAGVSAPDVFAVDLDAGLLLLEDLGDLSLGRALQHGQPQAPMWLAAVDVLVHLRRNAPPRALALPDGTTYRLPRFDRAALEIELALLLDWYWPAVMGAPCPADVRAEFEALWSPVLDRMLAAPAGLFLRDYHSPNLFWLPDRPSPRAIGVIDFQDALAEHWAYDVASLLQDARVDVPASLETAGLLRYTTAIAQSEPDFDARAFHAAYAMFGAQRNTRLVGLWVRLLQRDGKPHYLAHMSRTWDYLARNLAHPDLAGLEAWYDRHLPEPVRQRAIAV